METQEGEDILCSVPARYDKRSGSLNVTTKRVAFCPDGERKPTFTIGARNISKQKVTPVGEPKPKLQLVLSDTGAKSPKFIFTGPSAEANKDRTKEAVMNIMQAAKLPPTAGSSGGGSGGSGAASAGAAGNGGVSEANAMTQAVLRGATSDLSDKDLKVQVFSNNPSIHESWNQVVLVDKTMTESEFWELPEHSAMLASLRERDAGQEMGVVSGFMANMRPTESDHEETKYTITKEAIVSLFKLYPNLRKHYAETVPHIKSEQTFWEEVIKSGLYNRSVSSTSKSAASEEAASEILASIFGTQQATGVASSSAGSGKGAAGSAAAALQAGAKRKVCDPVYDLAADDAPNVDEEGYGNGSEMTRRKRLRKYQTMMATLNTDSLSILHTMAPEDEKKVDAEPDAEWTHRRLQEATEMRDLEGPRQKKVANLPVEQTAMLQQLGVFASSTASGETASAAAARAAIGALSLVPSPTSTLSGADAESVLVDLSSRHLCAPSPMQGGPPSVQNDVKRYDQAISMVLRHFWSCFNPRPPRGDEALADKAKRMADSLQRYKETKIKDLASRLPPENRPMLDLLVKRIDRALDRRAEWEAKLPTKKRKRRIKNTATNGSAAATPGDAAAAAAASTSATAKDTGGPKTMIVD